MHGVRLGRQRARHLGIGSKTDSASRCPSMPPACSPAAVFALRPAPVITRSPSLRHLNAAACPLARCRRRLRRDAGATAIAPNATAAMPSELKRRSLAVQLSAGSEAIDTLAAAPRRLGVSGTNRHPPARPSPRSRRRRSVTGSATSHEHVKRRDDLLPRAGARSRPHVCLRRFRQSSATARTPTFRWPTRGAASRLAANTCPRQRRARARRGRATLTGTQRKRYRQRGSDHRKHLARRPDADGGAVRASPSPRRRGQRTCSA